MNNIVEALNNLPFDGTLETNMQATINACQTNSQKFLNDADALQTMFNSIDLTTLSHTDSSKSVAAFVNKVNRFAQEYPDLKNVGGICVYSVFAPVMRATLNVEDVHRAVVAACFPSSQAFTEIKVAEVSRAVQAGATEVDVVISVGEFLDGEYQMVYEELSAIRDACVDARLKVILETGAIPSLEQIWKASVIAMEAGANFIKTSTGKNCGGATPEAAVIMCNAIKAYHLRTGRKVGFKPAGGVSTPAEACLYYEIVRSILGDEWLVNTLFRIGASRLANSLLTQILTVQGRPAPEKFF